MSHFQANEYQRCSFVPALGEDILVNWLKPKKNELICDLGCGDGKLTKKLQEMTERDVVGVDISGSMLDAARTQQGITRAVFQMDLQKLDSPTILCSNTPGGKEGGGGERFDAVFSNATLHWCSSDPGAVIDGVTALLKPSGRFVAEFGGKGNIASVTSVLISLLHERGVSHVRIPWFFPTVDEYRSLLEEKGFTVLRCELFHRPTPVDSIFDWITIMGKDLLQQLPHRSPEAEEEFKRAAENALRFSYFDSRTNKWIMDYVRIRVEAIKRV